MYYAMYGDEYIFDPISNDRLLSELRITSEVNTCGSCSFVIPPTNPCYKTLALRDTSKILTVYNDDVVIFDGYIYSMSTNMDMTMSVDAKGILSYLGDTLLRPYSSYAEHDPTYMTAPNAPADLFAFYIRQHNEHCGPNKTFTVGVNEANRLTEGKDIYRESGEHPTTANEITDKLLSMIGGYLFVRHETGLRYIDYRSDYLDTNAQIIDFGVNLLDYVKDMSVDDMYTAVRAIGATVTYEGSDETRTIDIKDVPDDTSYGNGYIKRGDLILYTPSVEKYGIIEGFYTNDDATTLATLANNAVAYLKTYALPIESIEIKAIDLAMLAPEHKPLVPGHIVRVRSIPHDYDAYLMVVSMDINIDNPDQSTYVLGAAKNSYTGVQNAKIKELNAGITDGFDAVSSLSDEVKASAIDIEEAKTSAEQALEKTENIIQFETDYVLDEDAAGRTYATLSATVLRGGEDVTDQYDDSNFTWYEKNDEKGEVDWSHPIDTGKEHIVYVDSTNKYFGSVVGVFEPAMNEVSLLSADYETLQDNDGIALSAYIAGVEGSIRVIDLKAAMKIQNGDYLMGFTDSTTYKATVDTYSEYFEEKVDTNLQMTAAQVAALLTI